MQTSKEKPVMNVVNILHERGFIEKTTHEEELIECFNKGSATCYIGFDPTASSLHIGHLIAIMSLAHMQNCGHRPIGLVGGGTGLVGDPSGKTEMRQLLTEEIVEANAIGIKNQLARFIDFSNGKALLLNNAEWLVSLKYIPFLRDIGRHFSVNRMIKAESYKMRLNSEEEGLSFIEFNYMVLQAYDFLQLFDMHGCRLQMGGSDQWGNIVAGIDLIRRVRQETAFGIVFPLLTTSSGAKMGKTAKGAVWLDPDRTTPYEYYQYWINTDDQDVKRFLSLFTFLPLEEVKEVEKLKGSELNSAKTILAFETTLLVHGKEETITSYHDASRMFGMRKIPKEILPSSKIHYLVDESQETGTEGIPDTDIAENELKQGIPASKIFYMTGIANSVGAAKRLIQQGGAYINDKRIESIDYLITDKDAQNKKIVLRGGKKRYHIINMK